MRKLRIGLIGCGAFGESYLAALGGIPTAEVVAVADVLPERARRLAERYHVPHVTSGIAELVARSDIDAVGVVTTENQHLEPVLAALQGGKHVIVEKPMATRLEDAQRMARAAIDHDRFLMPGHLLRFEPRCAMVKQQLLEGRLGRVLFVAARRNRSKGQGRTYKRTPLVLETAIHDIDLMLWFTGQKVKSVRGWTVSATLGEEADLFCAVLNFAGGAIGMLHTSWLLPDHAARLDDQLQVLTTDGGANIDVLNSGLSLWSNSGVESPDVTYEPRVNGYAQGALREQLAYFTQCCLEGRKPAIVSADDGVEAVKVSLALIQSAQENRPIEL